jgi:hypothetical protein
VLELDHVVVTLELPGAVRREIVRAADVVGGAVRQRIERRDSQSHGIEAALGNDVAGKRRANSSGGRRGIVDDDQVTARVDRLREVCAAL